MLNHPVKSLTVAGNHAGTHKATKAKGKGKNMAEKTQAEMQKEAEAAARAAEVKAAEEAAKAENDTRAGKGTRLTVSSTRGRNTQVVTYEAFDTDKPETLPTTIEEFAALSGISDEASLVSFLIIGANDFNYRKASDPIAEFVNPAWPAEVQDSFKISVRNMVKSGAFSIESAVAVMRPAIDMKFSA